MGRRKNLVYNRLRDELSEHLFNGKQDLIQILMRPTMIKLLVEQEEIFQDDCVFVTDTTVSFMGCRVIPHNVDTHFRIIIR